MKDTYEPPIVEVSNLYKIYQKGNIEIPAVKNISYKFTEGHITSIVGKSGSGKYR